MDREQKAPTYSAERDDENRDQDENGFSLSSTAVTVTPETKARRLERKRHIDELSTSA